MSEFNGETEPNLIIWGIRVISFAFFSAFLYVTGPICHPYSAERMVYNCKYFMGISLDFNLAYFFFSWFIFSKN